MQPAACLFASTERRPEQDRRKQSEPSVRRWWNRRFAMSFGEQIAFKSLKCVAQRTPSFSFILVIVMRSTRVFVAFIIERNHNPRDKTTQARFDTNLRNPHTTSYAALTGFLSHGDKQAHAYTQNTRSLTHSLTQTQTDKRTTRASHLR